MVHRWASTARKMVGDHGRNPFKVGRVIDWDAPVGTMLPGPVMLHVEGEYTRIR